MSTETEDRREGKILTSNYLVMESFSLISLLEDANKLSIEGGSTFGPF